MNLVKPCKIQVPAVHQIKGASLDDELIQDVDFVGLPVWRSQSSIAQSLRRSAKSELRLHSKAYFAKLFGTEIPNDRVFLL